jgi:hypothetical protein
MNNNRICNYCKKLYIRFSRGTGRGKKYCSRKCMGKARVGYKYSKEVKEKMSILAKKRILTPKGKKQFKEAYEKSFLYTHTPEALKKMVETRKRNNSYICWCKGKKRPEITKEKHFNWQGGISKEPYPFEFDNDLKQKIRKLYNYTCQICGMTEEEHLTIFGVVLIIHHIDYNKRNCEENNLISLCHSCHFRTNYNRSYWTEYFKSKNVELILGKDIN